jgi:hypothetical protein
MPFIDSNTSIGRAKGSWRGCELRAWAAGAWVAVDTSRGCQMTKGGQMTTQMKGHLTGSEVI